MCRQESRRSSPFISRPACQPVPWPPRRPLCRQLSLDQRHDVMISDYVAKCLGINFFGVSASLSITALAQTLTSKSLSVYAFAFVTLSDTMSSNALAYTSSTFSPSFSAFASLSVSDTMSISALAYTSSTFSPSVSACAYERVTATVSTSASVSRSTSLTKCVRLSLY